MANEIVMYKQNRPNGSKDVIVCFIFPIATPIVDSDGVEVVMFDHRGVPARLRDAQDGVARAIIDRINAGTSGFAIESRVQGSAVTDADFLAELRSEYGDVASERRRRARRRALKRVNRSPGVLSNEDR